MAKKREKVTEEQAKTLAEAYRITGNLVNLIKGVSHLSFWFGRFGATNRLMFIEALIQELGKNWARKEKRRGERRRGERRK